MHFSFNFKRSITQASHAMDVTYADYEIDEEKSIG